MASLFAPLRPRSIWITIAIVVVLGAVVIVLQIGAGRSLPKVASGSLEVVGIAFLAGGFVSWIRYQEPEHRPEVVAGLDRSRRRDLWRALRRGDLDELSDSDRRTAAVYASSYVWARPKSFSSSLLIVIGFQAQGAAQLVEWDGDWLSYVILIELCVVVVALIIGLPMQVRWFRNAQRISQLPVD